MVAAVIELGSRRSGDVEVLLARVRHDHRVVIGAEEGAVVGVCISEEIDLGRLGHQAILRQLVAPAGLAANDRAQAGKLHGRIGPVTGQDLIRPLRMIVFLGVHRADRKSVV